MIWSLYADVDTGANNQHVALGLLLDHTLLRMYSLAKSYSCFFFTRKNTKERMLWLALEDMMASTGELH